ncbi:MAG: hypothetical protein AAF961_07095 [Planctomycetota bacterium]
MLFLEDVGEPPYRIDRFLSQLRLAGKFDNLAGVLLGQFTDCRLTDEPETQGVDDVLGDYFLPLGVPVLQGYPAGHVAHNWTLPLNTMVRMDADAREVRALERSTAPRS